MLVIIGVLIEGGIKRPSTSPRLHTLPVSSVGHLIPVHVESVQIDGVRRLLVTVPLVVPHGELAGRDADHLCAIYRTDPHLPRLDDGWRWNRGRGGPGQ
jgi:hypothetical protein